MEETYARHWRGQSVLPPKGVIRWGDVDSEWTLGRINALPGWIGGAAPAAGIKWIAVSPENGARKLGQPKVAALLIINDPDTLYPLAVMEGSLISAVRTGANMGAAAGRLALRDAKTLSILGAGSQGRTQLLAMLVVRPELARIKIYDSDPAAAAGFARRMQVRTGREITLSASVDEAALDADILISATGSGEPLVHRQHLRPGLLYLHLAGHECAYEVIGAADKRYVDDWEQVTHRNVSSLAHMHAEGLIRREDITAELGAVMAGDAPGRENDSEIIYVNSVGLGIQDVVLGRAVLEEARARGLGIPLELWDEPCIL
jgi:ornithine cyclodeaminase